MAIIDLSRAPPPWSIEEAAGSRLGRLRLGHRYLSLPDVVDFRATSVAELNYQGHMLAVGVFVGGGIGLILAVALAMLDSRFLVGGTLFIGIGLMLVSDIRQGHSMVVHRVTIRLADGRVETFSCAEFLQAQALVAALGDRLGR